MAPGDSVAYYSAIWVMGEASPSRSFTALRTVLERLPHPFDMGCGFVPFRRDVAWDDMDAAAIHPLLDYLDFTHDNHNWGYLFHFDQHDMNIIAVAMSSYISRLILVQ